MAKNKKMSRDEQIEDVQAKLDAARKRRLEMAQQSGAVAPAAAQDMKNEFRMFWTKACKNYKNSNDIEDVLWLHLKASGHDKPELFERGISHFGLERLK